MEFAHPRTLASGICGAEKDGFCRARLLKSAAGCDAWTIRRGLLLQKLVAGLGGGSCVTNSVSTGSCRTGVVTYGFPSFVCKSGSPNKPLGIAAETRHNPKDRKRTRLNS